MDIPNKELKSHITLDHRSHSSISQYLKDQQAFFKKYIRWEWEDFDIWPALLIWSAIHKWVEFYREWITAWNKPKYESVEWFAITCLEEDVKKDKERIDYWKTWSYEKCVETIKIVLKNYYDNPPAYKPTHIEAMTVDDNWWNFPMPVKWYIDLIWEWKLHFSKDDSNVYIVDHKSVSRFTADWEVKPSYELQWWAYYRLCKAITGKFPDYCIFDEIIKSKADAFSWMYQWDLRDACDKYNVDRETGNTKKEGKYMTNDMMKEALLSTWEYKAITRKEYIVDFRTWMAHIAFKNILEMVTFDLYLKSKYDIPFIVNPYEQWDWAKSYQDWLSWLDIEELAF